jgi:hypothetical protein
VRTQVQYGIIDGIASAAITSANKVGPRLRQEQQDAIRRAIGEHLFGREPSTKRKVA